MVLAAKLKEAIRECKEHKERLEKANAELEGAKDSKRQLKVMLRRHIHSNPVCISLCFSRQSVSVSAACSFRV